MSNDAFTIPLDGVQYVCWKDRGKPRHRVLTDAEQTRYFTSKDKESTLNDILQGR